MALGETDKGGGLEGEFWESAGEVGGGDDDDGGRRGRGWASWKGITGSSVVGVVGAVKK
jgi:hypothetical protein